MKKESIEDKIKKIKLIIMDVDGVLTDGRLFYDIEGNEHKMFNVMDGSGMLYAHRSGIKMVMVSGNTSPVPSEYKKRKTSEQSTKNIHK